MAQHVACFVSAMWDGRGTLLCMLGCAERMEGCNWGRLPELVLVHSWACCDTPTWEPGALDSVLNDIRACNLKLALGSDHPGRTTTRQSQKPESSMCGATASLWLVHITLKTRRSEGAKIAHQEGGSQGPSLRPLVSACQ
jgi:hypothetical protein